MIMLIHGMQKLTLLDYPEHLAAVLFTGSCNFRCPFCQNGSLVLAPGKEPVIPEEEIFSFLKKRKGILTGVCITGGEPTLYPELPDLIRKIKALGYPVKLDTNGTNPSMIKALFAEGLLDYVAMDIKSSRKNYGKASGCPGISLDTLQETIDFLTSASVEYEFRTTVVKGLHETEDFSDIAQWLAGAKRYFLQTYQDSGRILQRELAERNTAISSPLLKLEPFSPEEMEVFLSILKPTIPSALLRGTDR